MGIININLSGSVINAEEKLNIHTSVSGNGGDDSIEFSGECAQLTGKDINLLNEIKMSTVYADVFTELKKMDKQSPEYEALVKLVSQSAKDDNATKKKKIREHIASFAEGVLVGVVTNVLTK